MKTRLLTELKGKPHLELIFEADGDAPKRFLQWCRAKTLTLSVRAWHNGNEGVDKIAVRGFGTLEDFKSAKCFIEKGSEDDND